MKDRPNRVYWHRNRWQYKTRTDERGILKKAWIPLGKHHEKELTAYFWDNYSQLQKSLSSKGEFNDLIDRYIKWMHKQVEIGKLQSNSTIRKIKDINQYIRPGFGPLGLYDIKPKHVQMYVDKRAEKAPNRAKKEAGYLKHMFDKARQWGLFDAENPVNGIEKPTTKPRDRVPEIWELQVFQSGASDFLKLYVDLAFMTGLRVGDLLSLRVDECTEEGIKRATSKTNAKFFIPWDEAGHLKRTIRDIMKLNKVQGLTVICSKHGKQMTYQTWYTRWSKRMKECIENGELKESFHGHDIRATFGDLSIEEGLDPSEQLTHKRRSTTDTYIGRKKTFNIVPLKKLSE